MTGVQTCALPICFPVTILGEWALVGQGPVVWVNQWRGVRYVITQDLRVFALAVQAQEMLVEAIVGDTMLITDVLWVDGVCVSGSPLKDRLRRLFGHPELARYGD